MGTEASVGITGLGKIFDSLKALEPKLRKKIARSAMRKGLKRVQARAEALAPKDTGALASKIKVKAGKRSRTWTRMKVVIEAPDVPPPPGGKKAGGRPFFYGAAAEYGVKSRNRPGTHFMEKAYEEEGPAAVEEIGEIIASELVNLFK